MHQMHVSSSSKLLRKYAEHIPLPAVDVLAFDLDLICNSPALVTFHLFFLLKCSVVGAQSDLQVLGNIFYQS